MKKWRILWFGLSGAILISQSVILYAMFLYAYFRGGIAEISVNSLGEASFEFWFLPACIIFSALGIWQYFKETIK